VFSIKSKGTQNLEPSLLSRASNFARFAAIDCVYKKRTFGLMSSPEGREIKFHLNKILRPPPHSSLSLSLCRRTKVSYARNLSQTEKIV
jgi:hypothetical protein